MTDKALRAIADRDLDFTYVHEDGRQCAFSRATGEYFLYGQGLDDEALCPRPHGDGGHDKDPSVEEWRSVVEHPKHYTWLPVEAIEITERFDFLVGNALKYLIRHQHKGKPLEDLRKARFYIDRAIKNMEGEQGNG